MLCRAIFGLMWLESIYPLLDRVITPDTPLDEAAKCALVSMDSTLKSIRPKSSGAGTAGV
jgi:hypothetical protein